MKDIPILRKIFPGKLSRWTKNHPGAKKLWMRLGVTFPITAEEEAAIFCGDDDIVAATLRKIIAEGRFVPDGDSYIPGPAVENFNREYGTDYATEDLGVDY